MVQNYQAAVDKANGDFNEAFLSQCEAAYKSEIRRISKYIYNRGRGYQLPFIEYDSNEELPQYLFPECNDELSKSKSKLRKKLVDLYKQSNERLSDVKP